MSTAEFTADVVRTIKFRDKMRGYHPEEVDAFLERAAAALELLQTRLAEATERVLKAETALETNSEADESIRRTLMLAQRTAELAVSEAKEDAQRIRDEAQADVDLQRSENNAACATAIAEATTEAETLRTQAQEALDTALAEAAATTMAADEQAEQRRRSCDEAIALAERESAERIEEARVTAEAARAAEADTARRELEAMVASLSAQRSDLRAQVEALSEYLATERARVLEALTNSLEGFSVSLSPSPAPALVDLALHAEPPIPLAEEAPVEAVPPDVDVAADPADSLNAWILHAATNDEPATAEELAAPEISNADALDDGPAAVRLPDAVEDTAPEEASAVEAPAQAEPAADEAAPSTLLFTLGEELHKDEASNPDGKPRKSLLGRRRS